MHWLLKIGLMSRLKSTGGGSLPRARGRNTSAPHTSSTLARNAPAILAVLRKGVALFYFLSGYQRGGGRFKQRPVRIYRRTCDNSQALLEREGQNVTAGGHGDILPAIQHVGHRAS